MAPEPYKPQEYTPQTFKNTGYASSYRPDYEYKPFKPEYKPYKPTHTGIWGEKPREKKVRIQAETPPKAEPKPKVYRSQKNLRLYDSYNHPKGPDIKVPEYKQSQYNSASYQPTTYNPSNYTSSTRPRAITPMDPLRKRMYNADRTGIYRGNNVEYKLTKENNPGLRHWRGNHVDDTVMARSTREPKPYPCVLGGTLSGSEKYKVQEKPSRKPESKSKPASEPKPKPAPKETRKRSPVPPPPIIRSKTPKRNRTPEKTKRDKTPERTNSPEYPPSPERNDRVNSTVPYLAPVPVSPPVQKISHSTQPYGNQPDTRTRQTTPVQEPVHRSSPETRPKESPRDRYERSRTPSPKVKMLGTLDNSKKSDWKSYLAPLVQAYNATKSDATGFSPHFLMFGWHPRLSVDAYLGTSPAVDEASAGPQTYGGKLKSRMQFAYDIAAKHARKVGDKNKQYFDRGKQEANLDVGDRVLVRNVGLRGKQKLADRWEETPYVVCAIPDPSIPVFKVRPENGSKIRTLHRNLLLPFNCIPVEEPIPGPKGKPANKPRVSNPPQVTRSDLEPSSDEGSSDSSVYVIPHKRKQRRFYKETSNGRPSGGSAGSRRTLPDVSQETSTRSIPGTLASPDPYSPSWSHPIGTPSVDDSPNPIGSPIQDPSSIPHERSDQTDTSRETTGAEAAQSNLQPPDPGIAAQPEPQQPRRSVRDRNPPKRYGEWVAPQIVWL